jgi:alpha-tubulin suppressor-like RCC1 family protein
MTSIDAGIYHACGITTLRAVYCWGASQYGQMGTGIFPVPSQGSQDEAFYRNPERVILPLPAIAISAGGYSTCVTLADYSLRCFGFNGNGVLGDGSYVDRGFPVSVVGSPRILRIP